MEEDVANAGARSLSMRPDRVQAFLRRPIIAVLAWTTAAGEPMATPVWFRYDGDRFLIYTTYATAKSKAVQRSGRACLCIQYPTPPHRYVTVRGHAKIIRDRQTALRLAGDLARRYRARVGARRFMQLAAENQGEHVISEVTPASIQSLDSAAIVNPLVLAAGTSSGASPACSTVNQTRSR